jgi:NIMA (never in mitosis gene a)-related kinase
MRRQQHEYLIKCEDYQEDSNGCYIYMELAHEDLETFIWRYKKSGKYIPEKVVLHIIFQILHGLSYLHKNNIIHRDIKPLNILMIGLNCKLSDFGGSRQLSNEFSKAETKIGTPYFISPEILHKSDYSFETDVWSFGVTLYYLCTLTFPFPEP